MKKYLFILLCLTAIFRLSEAQSIVTLKTTQSGSTTKEVTARDEIRMQPGFWVKPTGSNRFTARIDETVVCDPEYKAEISDPASAEHPHNRQLNTSLAVGSIDGAFDVSSMGGATYQVPIHLPEGVGGMTPQLSVTYNSHGSNGIMGIGWSLSGLSSITRTGRTIYHDGVSASMDFGYNSLSDRLALDGERLIVTEGGQGLTGTRFRTEVESFRDIERKGDGSNRYFVVTTKDGKTMEYGKTSDARMDVNGTGSEKTMAWWCNRVVDPYGNFVNYHYRKDASKGEQYIQKIEYGHKDGVVCSVVFGYDKRDDIRRFSIGKISWTMQQAVLLKHISVYTGNQRVGKYIFDYALTNGTSKLVGVNQENGAGERLNPTLFTWTGPAVNLNKSASYSCGLNSNSEYLACDFNGDGITDLMEVPKENNIWTLYEGGKMQGICSSTFNLKLTPNIGLELELRSLCGNEQIQSTRLQEVVGLLNQAHAHSVGDFDGDGVFELAVLTRKYMLSSSVCGYLYGNAGSFNVQDLNYNGHLVTVYKYTNGYANRIAQMEFPGSHDYLLAKNGLDFNHNGKAELVVGTTIYELDPSYNFTEIGKTSNIALFDRAQWADLNGDGHPDFIASGKDVYIQNSNDYSFTKKETLTNELLGIIDINGDGFYRLLMKEKNRDTGFNYVKDETGEYLLIGQTYHWCPDDEYYLDDPYYNPVYPNRPQSFYRYRRESYDNGYKLYLYNPTGNVTTYLGAHITTSTPGPAIIFDIDGDGSQDILLSRIEGSNLMVEKILYRFSIKEDNSGYTCQALDRSFSVKSPILGDFNGDGIMELMSSEGHCYRFATGYPGQLLASVTNGFNQKTLVEYASSLSPVYSKGANTWPIASLSGPLYVAKSVKQPTPSGQKVVNFSYRDGKVNLLGKGFLGFASVIAENTTLGVSSQTTTTFNLRKGIPSKTVATTTRGGKTYEVTTTYFIADIGRNSGRVRVYPREQKQKDIDGNITTTTLTIDDNGNTISEVTDYGGGFTKTVNCSGHTAMGYPQAVETIRKHPDDSTNFITLTTSLYNSLGSLIQKTEHAGTDKAVTTTYTYGASGNPESSVLEYFYNGKTRSKVETFVYDPTQRFVTMHLVTAGSETGSETETIQVNYDLMGRPLSQVDPDGLVTSHEYDNWGKPVRTRNPDGTTETSATRWADSRDGYYTIEQVSGKAGVTTYFDLAGREKSSHTKGPKDMDISSANTYNARGELVSVTSVTGDISRTTTYEYGADGQLKKEVTGNDMTEYVYNGRETTVKHNNKSTRQKLDAWGNIAETTDQLDNKVVYRYYSSGLPAAITAAGGVYRMEYDAAGNRTKLIDPNAGTITCTYDVLGRIRTQTDMQDKVKTVTYDDWGRVTRTKQDVLTVRYAYDPIHKDRLLSITDSAYKHSLTYTYDEPGRILSENRLVNGSGNFVTSYTYDGTGNVTTVKYPGNVTETRTYDAFGNLERVKVGSETVWTLTSMTGRNMTATLGGMTTQTTYSDKGLLTAMKTNNGAVRNFTYSFDPVTGMLNQRAGTNGTETFTYDNLYRLKTVRGGAVMDIEYDPLVNGNIRSKTGLGTYSYHTDKKHAVTGITGNSGIPEKQQDIIYTPFNMVRSIREGDYSLDFVYGPDQERIRTTLKRNNVTVKLTIFAGNFEQVTRSDTTTRFYYISGGEGLCAIYVRQTKGSATLKNGLYYVHNDHLGSIALITDRIGNIKQKCRYDAWGRRSFDVADRSLIFDRGYTGQEHLDEFGLINLNARLYDPVLGRFLSPDPYVQDPLFSQSFNRYAYCLNNPLIYTDPGGEKWWHWLIGDVLTGGLLSATASITATSIYGMYLPFSNEFYEVQKYISPIAVKPNVMFGSNQNGIGIDVSVGFNKGANGARYHFGATYYWSSYGGYNGWETRKGWEVEALPFVSYSTTTFKSGEFSQSTGKITIGDPFNNLSYENDFMFGLPGPDGGDRWRTAAVQINSVPFSVNLNMFTGDPGLETEFREEHHAVDENGNKYYTGLTANDLSMRAGVLSFGFGPIRIGRNSEKIRHIFQNKFAHDFLMKGQTKKGPYWFRTFNIKPRWYWSFGFNSGNTLW